MSLPEDDWVLVSPEEIKAMFELIRQFNMLFLPGVALKIVGFGLDMCGTTFVALGRLAVVVGKCTAKFGQLLEACGVEWRGF